MKRCIALLATASAVVLALAVAAPAEAGTAVPSAQWSRCSKHFELRTFSDHRGGYGYFVNCTNKTVYVRADLKDGPDPTDRKLAPGQKGTWNDDPRVGGGTTFRQWKVCTGSRCA